VDRPLKLSKKSSHLHSGTYDPQTGRLTLELNGGTVAHHDVPQDTIDGLESADSPGNFYHHNIRSVHDYTRVR